MNANQFAEKVQADGKTVRRFLRATMPNDKPGQGHRWALPDGKRELNRLSKQFKQWSGEHTRHPA